MARPATADDFDATVHAPQRLRICALLNTVDQAEFGFVQEQLEVSASVLSKHVGVLRDAGYLKQTNFVRDARQRVWLRLTRAGRTAYRNHVTALRAIVDQDAS